MHIRVFEPRIAFGMEGHGVLQELLVVALWEITARVGAAGLFEVYPA